MPRWLIAVLVFMFLWIGIGAAVFTFQKCGARALLLGNGGFSAAMMGMCDQ